MIAERTMLTTTEVAERWGVDSDKILFLIRSGQLTGINLAMRPDGRPRYRIALEEVQRFEEARSTKPPEPRVRRRRMTEPGKEYF